MPESVRRTAATSIAATRSEAADQHADAQAETDLDMAEHHRRQADERADDDAERDEHHVGDVGRAVGDTNARRRLGERSRRGDERHDVAALQLGRRKNRYRRPDRRSGGRTRRVRSPSRRGRRASGRRLCAVTTTSSVSVGMSSRSASSTSRTPSLCSSILATSSSRRPSTASDRAVAGSASRGIDRIRSLAAHALDEQPRVARELSRDPAGASVRQRRSGLDCTPDNRFCGWQSHRPPARLPSRVRKRRHSSFRSIPISRGASCARNHAAPTTPTR